MWWEIFRTWLEAIRSLSSSEGERHIQYNHDTMAKISKPSKRGTIKKDKSLNVWDRRECYRWIQGDQLTWEKNSRERWGLDGSDSGAKVAHCVNSFFVKGPVELFYCRTIFSFDSPLQTESRDFSNYANTSLNLATINFYYKWWELLYKDKINLRWKNLT